MLSQMCCLRTEHRKNMQKVAMDATNPIETDYVIKNQHGTKFSPKCSILKK